LAARFSLVRAREWITVGLTMLLLVNQSVTVSSHVTILQELSDTTSRVGLLDLGSLLRV
jgi:hypothetical protein